MGDDTSLAERVKRIRRIGYIGLGVGLLAMLSIWPAMLVWPLAISTIGLVVAVVFVGGLGLGIYSIVALNVNSELRAFIKGEQATRQAAWEVSPQGALASRPGQFALGAGMGLLAAGLLYFAVSFLVVILLRGLSGGEMESGSVDTQATPGCVLPIYILAVVALPFAMARRLPDESKPYFKDRWAFIGYAIGVLLVWVPALLVTAL